MSRPLDYSKWDAIELSDDEDIEVHKNIDKASFIRWKQADIHRQREERRQRIALCKQELQTNDELALRVQQLVPILRGERGVDEQRQAVEKLAVDLVAYDKVKEKVFEPDAEGNMTPLTTEQIFTMMISKVCTDKKLSLAADHATRLPEALLAELPVIAERQTTVRTKLAEEEREQNKKLTSENISRPGFDKTIIAKKPASSTTTAITASSSSSGKSSTKQTTIEVLNPGYKQQQEKAATKPSVSDVDLRDLNAAEKKMLDEFAKLTSYEASFRFIQAHPDIVQRTFSDHLLSKAFERQSKGLAGEARLCVQWSLALSYAMQMGPDGVGMFYRKMIQGNPTATAAFQQEVEASYTRLRDRCAVLAAEGKLDKMAKSSTASSPDHIDEDNSNLTAEQAAAFRTFPKQFQEALMENDMELINAAFDAMGKEEAERVMKQCQDTGLTSVLSEDEAQKLMEQDGKLKQAAIDAGVAGAKANVSEE